jgi:hypothetical protein
MKISSRGPLLAQDYKIAEILLLKQTQLLHPPTADETRQMQLFKDGSDGLVKCKYQLPGNAELSFVENPIFLPRKSAVTRLLIVHTHRRLMHAGVQQTLAEIRQQLWIPKGRTTVKKAIRKCFGCRRFNAAPLELQSKPDKRSTSGASPNAALIRFLRLTGLCPKATSLSIPI